MELRKNNAAVRAEHEAIRNRVGYYDFTHKLLEVTGVDACAFLNYIYDGAIGKAKVGQAKYTTMLNEDGVIIDDVIVFRVAEQTYWVSTLYIDELIAWLDAHKTTQAVSYREITGITTMYAVQGPESRKVLNAFLEKSIDTLKYFWIEDNAIDGIPVKIARSGYTGELGFEIYVHPDHAKLVEEKLEQCGKPYGIMQIKTDVIITSLPREKGFVLMSDLAGTNPLEDGFDWTLDLSKDFIGKAATLKIREEGAKRALLGFTVEDDAAQVEVGTDVVVNGTVAGKVTMFTYGYTVEKNIGFALVELAKAKVGDAARIGTVDARITERMFYDPENKRIRG